MNGDTGLKHYFPLYDGKFRVREHIRLFVEHFLPKNRAIVRLHPRQRHYKGDPLVLPDNFTIQNDNI